MMRSTFCFFVALIFHTGFVLAQPDVNEIEQYIEKARQEWGVPGMAVAIVKDGKVISSRGYGVLTEGEMQKVDGQTLFAIASNTKAFVASALGVLQDEGKLHFTDHVQQYIPEFQLYDSYASHEATIEDLLCHRLGLGTYSGDVIWYKSDFTAKEVIDRIKFVPQAYSLRAGYGYSNLMFITAGEVINKASGMPWNQFVKEKFFIPLDMKRTITSTNDLKSAGNYATPHKFVDGVNLPINWVNWDNMGAAGGVISSSEDMSKWMLFQLNNGVWNNDTILNPNTQNVLWTPHNNFVVTATARKVNPGTNFSAYGLGWDVSDFYGNRLITHGGGYDGMYSQVAMIPELKLGMVVLTNSMTGIATPIRNYVFNAFMEKEQKDWSALALIKSKQKSGMQKVIEDRKAARVLNTKPTFENEQYAGSYHTDMLGDIQIKTVNGQLELTFAHAPDLLAKLVHWHYDTWEIKWDNIHAWFDFGTIQFLYDNTMHITGFEFDVPNQDIFFDELRVSKVE